MPGIGVDLEARERVPGDNDRERDGSRCLRHSAACEAASGRAAVVKSQTQPRGLGSSYGGLGYCPDLWCVGIAIAGEPAPTGDRFQPGKAGRNSK